jgi:microcystin-dependent protein
MSYQINNISVVPPPGSVVSYTGSKAQLPGGWLLCDGAEYSRTTYITLYNVIGITYGAGDGTNTFNVPNFQAAFLRGAGSQTYSDITYGSNDRTINTAQGTALQTHLHSITDPEHNHSIPANSHNHGIPANTHTHSVSNTFYLYSTGGNTYANVGTLGSGQFYGTGTNTNTSNTSNFTVVNASSNILFNSASTNISATNGATGANGSTRVTQNANETIPFNYAINWIIKY